MYYVPTILKQFKSKGNKLNFKTVQGKWLNISKKNIIRFNHTYMYNWLYR